MTNHYHSTPAEHNEGPIRRLAPRGHYQEDKRPNKFAFGVAVGATAMGLLALAGNEVHDKYVHNQQIVDNYRDANKTLTYNSPDNPNDAPSTEYSHQLPEQVSPTDVHPVTAPTAEANTDK